METKLLSSLLAQESGEALFGFSADAFISKNKDVETFLKLKSVQSTKLHTSATYLVYDYSEYAADLLGYFTLATKMFTLNPGNLTARQLKIINRFVSLDEETNTFRLPAVLLAQFGRNFAEDSKSVRGSELMEIALDCVENAVSLTSGKLVFLECEPNEKLVGFYQKCGFFLTDNTVLSKAGAEMIQMFRFI